MSVLILAEASEGKFKKSVFEVTSYGKKVADALQTNCIVLSLNSKENEQLFNYGADKVLNVSKEELSLFNAKIVADIIRQAVEKEQAEIVIMDSSANSLYIAPLVSIHLNAGYASNVVALPSSTSPFIVKRKVFSNKAFNNIEITSTKKVLVLAQNSFGLHENSVSGSIEDFSPEIVSSNLNVEKTEKSTGTVSIADAEIVVSGGRGLKGPENWGMIEELASILGAATACSKPVSDLGWRPHSEHVGQTGKPVASNLYIAIGISGAIQHLAGVNSSKVKVVINTDAEAPFFKAADYGVVGDAFEVVPTLIEKLKEFKANNT